MTTRIIAVCSFILLLSSCNPISAPEPQYPSNPENLTKNQFIMLPLGNIKPQGWLKNQLMIQKNSLTGHLDEHWKDLMESSWRGGNGEAWERGPYYLDGLVPLAYVLDDPELKQKVEQWMEFILNSQQENGWFGPEKNQDRWPLAVGLKVLKQYYEGSKDERALRIIHNYFNYLNTNKPDWPDSEWRGVRAMENAVTGYWLYRQTQDTTVLKAIESIHDNCRDWTEYFEEFPWDSQALEEHRVPKKWDAVGLTAHVVNVAMAIKYPGIWSQQSGSDQDLSASFNGIAKLDLHHGQVGGRFSGDEHLSGIIPTQGTEMCAVVEYMFSLENLIEITGSNELADRLELLAFNSLPGTQTPDGWGHQYDQQSNQIYVSNEKRNWSSNGNAANVFGVEPNFGCCTANMHQGWPKYAQSLWMATMDAGLAAISYAPCTVNAKIADGKSIVLNCETDYPFRDQIHMSIGLDESASFPIYLRIPAWCDHPEIMINDEEMSYLGEDYVIIERKWNSGDRIKLTLPMSIETEKRYHEAVSVKRGPLYYSLRIQKEFFAEDLGDKGHTFLGAKDWGIKASSDWNYGIELNQDIESGFEVFYNTVSPYPFADEGDLVWDEAAREHKTWSHPAPVIMKTKGRKIPSWSMIDNSAGETPLSPVSSLEPSETIELIPYAAAKLRISEFPVIAK